jgi:hypothetical protein
MEGKLSAGLLRFERGPQRQMGTQCCYLGGWGERGPGGERQHQLTLTNLEKIQLCAMRLKQLARGADRCDCSFHNCGPGVPSARHRMFVYVRYEKNPTGWASIRELVQPAT